MPCVHGYVDGAVFRAQRLSVSEAIGILAQADGRPGEDAGWALARKFLQDTEEPRLPFSGASMIALGITDGRAIGEALKDLQARWIKAGFPTDPASLAQLLNDMPRGVK